MNTLGTRRDRVSWRVAMALLASVGLILSFMVSASIVLAAHSDYAAVASTGTITPGTTEIGLAGTDDEFVEIVLPFPISFYGTTYTSAAVSSNGNVQFDVINADDDYDDGECLPEDDFGPTVFGYFGDIYLDQNPGEGVYSAVTGVAPNRQFILEWRGVYFDDDALPLNFEIIFYESSDTITVIYGDTSATPSMFMVGVQEAFDARLTQWACGDPLAELDGTRVDFGLPHGTLQFDPASYTVAEDAGNAFVTVTRTGGSEGEATVLVTATGGTASAADYAFIPTTLTFADGETTRTFGVSIVNDGADEPDETIVLSLSNPSGFATLGAATTATVTITDNDPTVGTATPTPAASQLPNTATGSIGSAAAGVVGLSALLAAGVVGTTAALVLERRRRRG